MEGVSIDMGHSCGVDGRATIGLWMLSDTHARSEQDPMTNPVNRIHIGTSGWMYDHWRGPFYPDNLDKQDWIRYYGARFKTVEINNTFYQLPSCDTLTRWRDCVAEDFLFTVKASRYITHMKKLKDPGKIVPHFVERIRVLGGRLGPVLFQLPPAWRVNTNRLDAFLDALEPGLRYAFEFRDPSWYTDAIHEVLARHGAAFCIYELAGHQSPEVVTTDFVYIRLHGPGEAYQGCYDRRTLVAWKNKILGWAADGSRVYCYFDNDAHGYAARNATELQALVSGAEAG